MPGSDNNFPTTGVRRRNAMTTGKKSPNKLTNPNASKPIPITGNPRSTITIPKKKNTEAFIFRFWKKKRTDRVGPMMRVTPDRYNTFPIANNPLSKKNAIPNIVNASPNAVNPIPILRTSVMAKGDDMLPSNLDFPFGSHLTEQKHWVSLWHDTL